MRIRGGRRNIQHDLRNDASTRGLAQQSSLSVAKFGQAVDLGGRHWRFAPQSRHTVVELWLKVGRCWSNSVLFRPKWAQLGQNRPDLVELDIIWTTRHKIAQTLGKGPLGGSILEQFCAHRGNQFRVSGNRFQGIASGKQQVPDLPERLRGIWRSTLLGACIGLPALGCAMQPPKLRTNRPPPPPSCGIPHHEVIFRSFPSHGTRHSVGHSAPRPRAHPAPLGFPCPSPPWRRGSRWPSRRRRASQQRQCHGASAGGRCVCTGAFCHPVAGRIPSIMRGVLCVKALSPGVSRSASRLLGLPHGSHRPGGYPRACESN